MPSRSKGIGAAKAFSCLRALLPRGYIDWAFENKAEGLGCDGQARTLARTLPLLLRVSAANARQSGRVPATSRFSSRCERVVTCPAS